MKNEDHKTGDAGRAWLARESDNLDAHTQSQLNRARQCALEAMDKQRAPVFTWPLAGATAAAVLVAVLMVSQPEVLPETGETEIVAAAPADDLELLLAVDSLEMIDELEFFELLSAMEADASTAG